MSCSTRVTNPKEFGRNLSESISRPPARHGYHEYGKMDYGGTFPIKRGLLKRLTASPKGPKGREGISTVLRKHPAA